MSTVPAGTWVEISRVILEPGQRAPNVPEDTARTPYVMRVSGWLLAPAALGQPARVRTLIGRELEGTLQTVEPSYTHSFGHVVPELLDIGTHGGRP
ncbi:MAG: 2-amino-4-ketopentanoate thiolase, alpha subunit [Candidatus Ozemobacter sibiricus]|jgi:hypothetical protein|uniref:2-amino-4-ketopentanoate thiolase, alpha subunit n=1 Tax=Candidatus Ozemobacter sibiricus TaxID=2268124 RepID=A0A367ZLQ4_9BACT|nr:MAG: 2-amino-4-ketopentanoate thiolase, alpha subunit [Candidatus Ozemobacter sibiricus]